MLNFIVFDSSGTRLGAFKVANEKVQAFGEPNLPSPLITYLQSIWNKGGEQGLRRYITSLDAHNSGYVFRENPGGV